RELIARSITSLESVLAADPDDAVATYALGYLRAFRVPGTGDVDEAARLLRRAHALDPSGPVGVCALRFLPYCYFSEFGTRTAAAPRRFVGRPPVERARLREVVEAVVFSMKQMPAPFRDGLWVELGRLIRFEEFGLRGGLPDRAAAARDVLRLAEQPGTTNDRAEYVRESLRDLSLDLGNAYLPANEAASLLASRAAAPPDERDFAATRTVALDAVKAGRIDEAVALLTEAADAELAGSSPSRLRHDWYVLRAAEALADVRLDAEAIEQIESRPPAVPDDQQNSEGGHLAVLHARLLKRHGERDRARDIAYAAAEVRMNLVDQSVLRLPELIRTLGGPPRDPDTDIDLTYVDTPEGLALNCVALVASGPSLYAADLGGRAVFTLRSPRQKWSSIRAPGKLPGVSALAIDGGVLAVGTREDGLFGYRPDARRWHRWSMSDGLSSDAVRAAVFAVGGLFLSLGPDGSKAAGHVARIDGRGTVEVFTDRGDPPGVNRLLVERGVVTAVADEAVYRFVDGAWERSRRGRFHVPGATHRWRIRPGEPILRLGPGEPREYRFRWGRGNFRAGDLVSVDWAYEIGGRLWLGGASNPTLANSGLVSLDVASGEVRAYGPRDGLRMTTDHRIGHAVVIEDALWIGSLTGGVAKVTVRAGR
ncbi:MAG: hypothetical protein AAGJ97_07380, partial [Planctomycetota bacterium]